MSEMRKFKFYMNDPEDGSEFSLEETVPNYDNDFEYELDYLLDQFKKFLLATGWSEVTLSRLQYLEDDEWKYVLEKYHKWDTSKQELYEDRKRHACQN